MVVFIDKRGMVQAQYSGQDDFFKDPPGNTRAMIEKLVKQPAAPPAKKVGPAKK